MAVYYWTPYQGLVIASYLFGSANKTLAAMNMHLTGSKMPSKKSLFCCKQFHPKRPCSRRQPFNNQPGFLDQ